MTRTTPLRRMILQLRQIFFTEASTFMCHLSQVPGPHSRTGDGHPRHFARKMIRARVRSYGVKSTVTLSPGSILM